MCYKQSNQVSVLILVKTILLIQGIQGYQVHIDENGDAEGNYTLLSRQQYKTNVSEYSMLPAGHFQIGKQGSGLPVITVLVLRLIYMYAHVDLLLYNLHKRHHYDVLLHALDVHYQPFCHYSE